MMLLYRLSGQRSRSGQAPIHVAVDELQPKMQTGFADSMALHAGPSGRSLSSTLLSETHAGQMSLVDARNRAAAMLDNARLDTTGRDRPVAGATATP